MKINKELNKGDVVDLTIIENNALDHGLIGYLHHVLHLYAAMMKLDESDGVLFMMIQRKDELDKFISNLTVMNDQLQPLEVLLSVQNVYILYVLL